MLKEHPNVSLYLSKYLTYHSNKHRSWHIGPILHHSLPVDKSLLPELVDPTHGLAVLLTADLSRLCHLFELLHQLLTHQKATLGVGDESLKLGLVCQKTVEVVVHDLLGCEGLLATTLRCPGSLGTPTEATGSPWVTSLVLSLIVAIIAATPATPITWSILPDFEVLLVAYAVMEMLNKCFHTTQKPTRIGASAS